MILEVVLASVLTAMPKPVRGDFDHDGRTDVAEVLAKRAGGFILVVSRAADLSKLEIVDILHTVMNFYLDKQEPGELSTTCGKGIGRDKECLVPLVTLSGDTLAFGSEEASRAVAIWNGKNFVVEWVSD